MTLETDLLSEVLGQHPARKLDFDALYSGLMEQVKSKYIRLSRHNELELFTYSQSTVYERNWNLYTLISRGLILHPPSKAVIATPFPKFFNYGEMEGGEHPELCSDSIIYEKMDGSLAIVFYFGGEWHCATKGSFTSGQALWAKKWINQHAARDKLIKGHTYLFEIIYPENKIIVDYDYSGLVLLSAYDSDGFEYSHNDLVNLAETCNFKAAKTFDFSDMRDLLEKAKILDKNNEGWVVRFPSGYRLKIKGEEYVRIHRLLSNITPLGIWDILLKGDNVENLRSELPEELLKDFDIIYQILNTQINALLDEIFACQKRLQKYDDKIIGLSLKNNEWPDGSEITDVTRKFLFTARKSDLNAEMRDINSQTRERIFRFIKPKANILEGYTPTDAMTRFNDESF
jgi:RNA ligase